MIDNEVVKYIERNFVFEVLGKKLKLYLKFIVKKSQLGKVFGFNNVMIEFIKAAGNYVASVL